MSAKEAKARIKINRLLEEAGWRFFDDEDGNANIVLEPNVKITQMQVSGLGENFEKTKNGFIDFLLLDEVRVYVKCMGKEPNHARRQEVSISLV